MSEPFLFIILAVTKTDNKYGIAGMDQNGKWFRPLPIGNEKFWPTVRYRNDDYMVVGDVWEITSYEKEYDASSPGHTEDIRLFREPMFHGRLSHGQLINFVYKYKEDKVALHNTLRGNSRSLCLIAADSFKNFLDRSSFDRKLKPMITFLHDGKQYSHTSMSTNGFPLIDVKWVDYTNQQVATRYIWDSLYVCVGVERNETMKGINREEPMIISVITEPQVPLLPSNR
jgi:hypothetical protein